ncbi:MAG: flavodoxin [Clostridiales bacterium]|nr:flavodoxin [Clostridiales bacterium]
MKRWIAMILCFCITNTMIACGQINDGDKSQEIAAATEQQEGITTDDSTKESVPPETPAEEISETDVTDIPDTSAHILVAYFSCTGNTATLAEYVADITGADLYEIVPEDPYSDDDLNYRVDNCRANLEQNDSSCRPVIGSEEIENIQNYDTIFVAFPIWLGEEPRIIDTFMESYDFSGITMIPFCTSGSSGIGTAQNHLQSMTTEKTIWLDGSRFAAGSSRDDVEGWIVGLKLTER